MSALATAVWFISRIIIFSIIVYVFLSYFLDRYHPIRMRMDAIFEPVLSRIRAILPDTGALDLSPLILILILELITRALIQLLT
ncbi:MAG: YggT family protein [Anaerolineales bacterium]